MSQALIIQMRRAREGRVAIGDHTFIFRRPTDAEATSLLTAKSFELATRFVIGWDGVQEQHLIPGGTPDKVAFDADLWREWCADRPDFWTPIAEAIIRAYNAHDAELEARRKN